MKGILMELLKWWLAMSSGASFAVFALFATTDMQAFQCVCFFLLGRFLWAKQSEIE